MKIIKRIKNIANEAVRLKDKYVSEAGLTIDWICIFSQNDDDYSDLLNQADEIGKRIEIAANGVVFKLTKRISTGAGNPKVLKVRKPDPLRPEMGDVDFTTDYNKFKRKHLSRNYFNLIKREKFEMIELMVGGYNARVYFSSIPPSKLRGIK